MCMAYVPQWKGFCTSIVRTPCPLHCSFLISTMAKKLLHRHSINSIFPLYLLCSRCDGEVLRYHYSLYILHISLYTSWYRHRSVQKFRYLRCNIYYILCKTDPGGSNLVYHQSPKFKRVTKLPSFIFGVLTFVQILI